MQKSGFILKRYLAHLGLCFTETFTFRFISNKVMNLKHILLRDIAFRPHLMYKTNYLESLALDRKTKNCLERNLDSRKTKP